MIGDIRLNTVANLRIPLNIVAGPQIKPRVRLAIHKYALTILLASQCFSVTGMRPAFATEVFVGSQAPEFVRTDISHKKLDLKAYRGKVILLNFWATWCPPCQVEIPSFVAWQNKYGPRGLQIIGISMDDDPALVLSLYGKLRLNYPVAMGDEMLGELYGGVFGLPVTFLIDRRGNVRAKYQGETNLKKVELQVQSFLPRQ